MKISQNWLEDFIHITQNPKDLSALLSNRLTEVENFETQEETYKGIVAAKILNLEKIKDSKHLWYVTLNAGESIINVVCGAPNLKRGQIVPLITVHAKVPRTGNIINEATILQKKSSGMLATAYELNIGEDHSKIYSLDEKTKPGTEISKCLNLDDIIYSIENKALTHRGDCFSIEGIARELGAITNKKADLPKYVFPKTVSKKIDIQIENSVDCPRYMAVLIKNIDIKESAPEIQKRLIVSGMRPINNIVDFTNYVMLETGQPLHAFDADKLGVDQTKYLLGVRRAIKNETLDTLDKTNIKLRTENLVITNNNKPIALAGVMGGIGTQVDDKTKVIILESANFSNFTIRKSARTSSLRTEASLRFEKDLDPNLAERGVSKFLDLLKKYNAGEVVGIVDHYPKKTLPVKIKTSLEFINNRCGFNFKIQEILNIFSNLDLKAKNIGNNLTIEIPTFRRDLKIQEDLVEEVARLYGYEKIKPYISQRSITPVLLSPKQHMRRILINVLRGLNYTQIYSYSFVGGDMYSKAGMEMGNILEIVNPLSPDLKYIRNSLIPNILEKINLNKARFSEFKLFEMGKEIVPSENKRLPLEKQKLCMAYYKENAKNNEHMFRVFKGEVEQVLHEFSMPGDDIVTYKIQPGLIIATIDLDVLFDKGTYLKDIKEVSIYSPIIEDVSLYINPETKIGPLITETKKLSDLISNIELMDIYEKEGQRSITIKITYENASKQLSYIDVEPVRNKILNYLVSMGLKPRVGN